MIHTWAALPTPNRSEAHCCSESSACLSLRQVVSTTASSVRPYHRTGLLSSCHGLKCASNAARSSGAHATRRQRTGWETSRLRRGSRGVNPVPTALWGDWVGATVPLLPQAGRPSKTGSAPPRLTELTDPAPSRDDREDRLTGCAAACSCKARRRSRLLPDGSDTHISAACCRSTWTHRTCLSRQHRSRLLPDGAWPPAAVLPGQACSVCPGAAAASC